MDIVPGMVTYIWLTPSRTGTFDVMCAELCGVGHHVMRGIVVIDTEKDYESWLAEQSTFEELVNNSKTLHIAAKNIKNQNK